MLQMGFDLDYVDGTTGMKVPFDDFSGDLVNKIHHARWKVVDLETSGLNDTDSEQNFSGKDLRRGVDATLRVRVATILWQEADGTIRFDVCAHADMRFAATGASSFTADSGTPLPCGRRFSAST